MASTDDSAVRSSVRGVRDNASVNPTTDRRAITLGYLDTIARALNRLAASIQPSLCDLVISTAAQAAPQTPIIETASYTAKRASEKKTPLIPRSAVAHAAAGRPNKLVTRRENSNKVT